MHMAVGYGLSGGSAFVDTDIVACGAECVIQVDLGLFQQGKHGFLLGGCQVKKGAGMAAGNDQAVAFGHGVAITDQKRVFVALQKARVVGSLMYAAKGACG